MPQASIGDAVYIDSGAFIAFLVDRDRMHERTVALFSRPPDSWLTSSFVVAEAYGWFLHRLGETAARRFRGLLDDMSGLQILHSDADHLAATWEKLDALRGAKLTLVDASSLVWLTEQGIDRVWGTDYHLGLEGAAVLPGSG